MTCVCSKASLILPHAYLLITFIRQIGIDGETCLHNETDPRYRGPAIPSKAFKFLQTMTDGYPDMSSPYQTYHGNRLIIQ